MTATMTMPWTARVLTLFPEMFPGSLGQSLADTMRDFVTNGRVGTMGVDLANADLNEQGMSWICYGDPGLSVGPNAR